MIPHPTFSIFKTTELLAINVSIDGYIPRKPFVVDDAVFVPPDQLTI